MQKLLRSDKPTICSGAPMDNSLFWPDFAGNCFFFFFYLFPVTNFHTHRLINFFLWWCFSSQSWGCMDGKKLLPLLLTVLAYLTVISPWWWWIGLYLLFWWSVILQIEWDCYSAMRLVILPVITASQKNLLKRSQQRCFLVKMYKASFPQKWFQIEIGLFVKVAFHFYHWM